MFNTHIEHYVAHSAKNFAKLSFSDVIQTSLIYFEGNCARYFSDVTKAEWSILRR